MLSRCAATEAAAVAWHKAVKRRAALQRYASILVGLSCVLLHVASTSLSTVHMQNFDKILTELIRWHVE